MKITSFSPDGLDVVSLGLFSTGYVSTSSNSYSSAVASNTLAVGGVLVTGAAASNYHMLASSPTAAAWVPDAPVAAPTTADYLVGTAQAGLSAEIVVGTTPGGELGGTWASPTVDATHSGSTHAHDHWHGPWSDATAYVPGDMVSLDGASWVCLIANTALRPFPPDYREASLITAPFAYWRVGEASGTNVDDEIGTKDGTYVNAPTLGVAGALSGDVNTATTFAAVSSQDIGIANGSPATDIGFAIWIKSSAATGRPIGARTGGAFGWMLEPSGAGYRLFALTAVGNSAGVTAVVGSNSDGAWHMYVGYITDTVVGLSVDAGAYVTAAVSGWNKAALDLSIGLFISYFTGTLDEPAVWDRALTPAEIAGLNAVGTGTVVWERLTPPAAYVDPTTATATDIANALIAAGLMAAS